MRTILAMILFSVAASVHSQPAARQDVPDVQNDFWNTSARRQEPVVVDQCAAATSLSALESRMETRLASAAIGGLDSRFMSQSVSNGTDIRNPTPTVILIR